MAIFGVTNSGFVLKRLPDILEELSASFGNVTDPNTGESLTPNLLNENDPLVQTVNSFADALANCWEQLQLCYNQFDPLKATGAGLSGLVQLNAIFRQPGFPSTVDLICTGDAGKFIPAGKRVTLLDDSVVFELPAFTFDGFGLATVNATCIEDGPNEVAPGQLVKIVTPSAGWASVTNPAPAIPGQFEQSDTELRAQQQASTENTGRGMIDDLFSSVNNVDGVIYCRAYQNQALIADERGIDPKSVAIVVLGGDEDAIAGEIFAHIPIACGTYGSTTRTIIDDQGFSYDINFSRPNEISFYIDVVVDPFSDDWPVDGTDLVAEAILEFSLGYNPGESVYASQFYTSINSIAQSLAQIISVEIGLVGDSAPSGQVLNMEWNEIAILVLENISVTEV